MDGRSLVQRLNDHIGGESGNELVVGSECGCEVIINIDLSNDVILTIYDDGGQELEQLVLEC